jgi:hypothetical protein
VSILFNIHQITQTKTYVIPILPLSLKKTEEEERKTTIFPKHSASIAEDQFVQTAAITMEGNYCISRKLHHFEAAKVSGLVTKLLITKPQQAYTSMGIEHQLVTNCTGSSTNGRGAWDEITDLRDQYFGTRPRMRLL